MAATARNTPPRQIHANSHDFDDPSATNSDICAAADGVARRNAIATTAMHIAVQAAPRALTTPPKRASWKNTAKMAYTPRANHAVSGAFGLASTPSANGIAKLLFIEMLGSDCLNKTELRMERHRLPVQRTDSRRRTQWHPRR